MIPMPMTTRELRDNNYSLGNNLPVYIYHTYFFLLKWGFRQDYIRVYIHENGKEYSILHKESKESNELKFGNRFINDISLQFLIDARAGKEKWPRKKDESDEQESLEAQTTSQKHTSSNVKNSQKH